MATVFRKETKAGYLREAKIADKQFDAVVDAAEKLSLDEQETLVDILGHRITERRRSELAKDVQDAQQEFRHGACSTATPGDLMKNVPPPSLGSLRYGLAGLSPLLASACRQECRGAAPVGMMLCRFANHRL